MASLKRGHKTNLSAGRQSQRWSVQALNGANDMPQERCKTWYRLRDQADGMRVWSQVPRYREGPGSKPRSLIKSLPPESVLAPSELSEVKRLHRRLALLEGRGDDQAREIKLELKNRISVVAAASLTRRVGIERFMVLDVERDDGYRASLQVLEVGMEPSRGWRWSMWWSLSGRSLRKDRTLGERPASINFGAARVLRRTLSGAWVSLTTTPVRRKERDALRHR